MAPELRNHELPAAGRLSHRAVNPFLVGQAVHGEAFRASVRDVPEPVDLVNVFRRSDAIGEVVEGRYIRRGAGHLAAARDPQRCRLRPGGGSRYKVVANRCISVEHARLLG
jgi:predicted CoA-binding protein